jgi:hypothetical protein
VNESQCNATYVDYPSAGPSPSYANPYSNPAFWLILCLAPLQNFMYSAVRVITDTGAMNILGEERKDHYGKQRLWGSVLFFFSFFLDSSFILLFCC